MTVAFGALGAYNLGRGEGASMREVIGAPAADVSSAGGAAAAPGAR
jgi:hypothetical protein